MGLCGGTPWRLTCNGLRRRKANLSEGVGVPAFAGTTVELCGGTPWPLSCYGLRRRTANLSENVGVL